MPTADIDGIATRYEVVGDGPPLLLFSPGGFDARLEHWATMHGYAGLDLVPQLARAHTVITFDKRESGRSGGRFERIGWHHYVAQGRGLLAHLGIERAHLMGGCVGCSIAVQFAVSHPEATGALVLWSPAGGARYRMAQHRRFARHLAFVDAEGLPAVVALAGAVGDGFSADPRVGPWVEVIRADPAFAASYAAIDAEGYRHLVTAMVRTLFDRDTVPGPEPEDLLLTSAPALVVSGEDASHAPSAARYLLECLPGAVLWDVPVADRTAAGAAARILELLASGPPVG